MSNPYAQAIRQAGKLYRKAVFNGRLPVKTIRANYDALLGTAILPNNIDRQEVDVGPVLADLLVPELAIGKRTILYAHGGGFISGSRLSARNLCCSLAHESASRLLLPEYRLAPEYPYPTALEDLYHAYAWLLRQGTSPSDIIVAGDGAGANLVISLVHYLRDKQVPVPAAAAVLSPWIDLACDSAVYSQRKHPDPVHTREILAGEALLYTYQGNLTNPNVSPIHGDFTAFPPLYIQCGSEELLLDDAKRLAQKAQNSGGEASLDVRQGMWHLFQAIDSLTPEAHNAVRAVGKWIREGRYGDALKWNGPPPRAISKSSPMPGNTERTRPTSG